MDFINVLLLWVCVLLWKSATMMFCTPPPTKICQYDIQNIQRLHPVCFFFDNELLMRCEVEERHTCNFWREKLWTRSRPPLGDGLVIREQYLFIFILAHHPFYLTEWIVDASAPISGCFCSCDREGSVLYLTSTHRERQRKREREEEERGNTESAELLSFGQWLNPSLTASPVVLSSFWLMLKSILVVWVK